MTNKRKGTNLTIKLLIALLIIIIAIIGVLVLFIYTDSGAHDKPKRNFIDKENHVEIIGTQQYEKTIKVHTSNSKTGVNSDDILYNFNKDESYNYMVAGSSNQNVWGIYQVQRRDSGRENYRSNSQNQNEEVEEDNTEEEEETQNEEVEEDNTEEEETQNEEEEEDNTEEEEEETQNEEEEEDNTEEEEETQNEEVEEDNTEEEETQNEEEEEDNTEEEEEETQNEEEDNEENQNDDNDKITQDVNQPVNGVCGTNKNVCTQGNLNGITDNSTHYLWNCNGLYGGSDVSCSKEIPPTPENGVCNNAVRNGCTTGTTNEGAYSDTSTHYKWRCEGLNGGSNSAVCSIEKPVNGVCGTNKNTCSQGNLNDITDNSTHYLWNCNGLYDGNGLSCSKPIPVSETNDIEPDSRVTVERTTNKYNNKPQLIINVTGTHLMFRSTQNVESANTICASGQTPSVSRWFELFGPVSLGLGDNGEFPTTDYGSYKITQRTTPTLRTHICFIVIYGDADSSSEDKEYIYYGPYSFE